MGDATKKVEKSNMKKILASICKNTKKDAKTIGKEIGLTRQTVSRLIKKMENNNIIWGYPVTGDASFLDLKHYVLMAKIKPNVNKEKTLAKYWSTHQRDIEKMEDVYILDTCVLHGKYDFCCRYLAKDLTTARGVMYLIFNGFLDCIDDYELMECTVDARQQGILNPKLNSMIKKYNEK